MFRCTVNTTDTINHLFDSGVISLILARSPEGIIVARAIQGSHTMKTEHQVQAPDVVQALRFLTDQVEYANEFKSRKILTPTL